MSDDEVLTLEGGRVALGSSVVVDQVDFALSAGEFLALLGTNGSGKTTLVRALLGLVPLLEGTVRVFGRPLDEFRRWERIGYVPQRAAMPSGGVASVLEVTLSGRISRSRPWRSYGKHDRTAALRALEVVGLADSASVPVVRLSGGQQQRALIARALASEPDVLVLDEPLSAVDIDHQEKVSATLRDFHDRRGTVLLVAHGLGSMQDLVTREVVMHAGKVVYDGPHHPHHVHADEVHHPGARITDSPLDRAAGPN